MKIKFLITLFLIYLCVPSNSARAQTKPSVDLLWSANTYAPFFYLGHSVATPQSQIKVVAVTNWPGNTVADLNFRWQKNGQNLVPASGDGRDVLTFRAGNAGETNRVAVRVSDSQGFTQDRVVEIPVRAPSVSVYTDEPLLGVNYGQAVSGNITLAQPEISLVAEPYFFPKTDVTNQKIEYDWQLNSQKVVPNPNDNRQVTFVAPSGTKGENSVSLEVKSLENLFQKAKREFKILFGLGQDFNF